VKTTLMKRIGDRGTLSPAANRAFRAQISNAILVGDGVGKPMGLMHPQASIPICNTSEANCV